MPITITRELLKRVREGEQRPAIIRILSKRIVPLDANEANSLLVWTAQFSETDDIGEITIFKNNNDRYQFYTLYNEMDILTIRGFQQLPGEGMRVHKGTTVELYHGEPCQFRVKQWNLTRFHSFPGTAWLAITEPAATKNIITPSNFTFGFKCCRCGKNIDEITTYCPRACYQGSEQMGEPHLNLLATISVGAETLQGFLPVSTLMKLYKITLDQFIEREYHFEDKLSTFIKSQPIEEDFCFLVSCKRKIGRGGVYTFENVYTPAALPIQLAEVNKRVSNRKLPKTNDS